MADVSGIKRKYVRKVIKCQKGIFQNAKIKCGEQLCTKDSYSAKILDDHERKTFFLYKNSVK
jgi:hypothetical protein